MKPHGKKAILVTGVSGSGKSRVSSHFRDLGYESYDIEAIEGMFAHYRKDTGEVFEDYENIPKKIGNADWICDKDKLKKLLDEQKSNLAFYFGVPSNMDDIFPLFQKVIVLTTSPETLAKRLSSREGTDAIGATEETRQMILGWKDWWENQMKKKNAVFINAEENPDEVTKKILEVTL